MRRFTLFRLFGIPVRVDTSWIFLAFLVTWSLARGLFYQSYEDLDPETYWWMGAAGALSLFLSIIVHELGHALTARYYKIPIRSITLLIFGGVAELEGEPPHPRSEFLVALAGPAASLFLGLATWAGYAVSVQNDWPIPVEGLFRYTALLNIALAIFNLIPAFPLDGGRILRALLWAWKKDLQASTRITSGIGVGFGNLMLLMGLLSLVSGRFMFGLWWIFLGIFLRGASQVALQRQLIREVLRDEPITRFIAENPVVVPYYISLKTFVEDYIYRYQDKVFPVVDAQGELLGCIHARSLSQVPAGDWGSHTVKELLKECDAENTISIKSDALEALEKMNRTRLQQLLVTDGPHLKGIVSLKQMLQYIAGRLEQQRREHQ